MQLMNHTNSTPLIQDGHTAVLLATWMTHLWRTCTPPPCPSLTPRHRTKTALPSCVVPVLSSSSSSGGRSPGRKRRRLRHRVLPGHQRCPRVQRQIVHGQRLCKGVPAGRSGARGGLSEGDQDRLGLRPRGAACTGGTFSFSPLISLSLSLFSLSSLSLSLVCARGGGGGGGGGVGVVGGGVGGGGQLRSLGVWEFRLFFSLI